MAFSLGSLGSYSRQSVTPLLTTTLFGSKFQDMVMQNGIVLTGVKSSERIPLYDTDAIFQNQSCTFDPSGTTTITQREVTVGKIKVEERICPKDLEAYFTQEALRAGSTYEDFGWPEFERAFLERKASVISKQLEVALWQGDTASGNANLNRFDGLMKLIDAGSSINANVAAFVGTTITQITSANVITAVRGVKNAIPADLKGMDDVVIFCGYDVYDLYVDAGITANLFNYNFNDESNYGGLRVPGTGIRLEAVHGLDGTGDLYAFRMSNVCMGVDLESDVNNFRFWYSQDANDVRFRAEWKAGVNVAFTSECVRFKSTI